MRVSNEERFMSKVVIGDSGCWTWQDYRNKKWYGRFRSEGRFWLAHRWAYQHWVGSLAPGLTLDHLCNAGMQGCVNPYHLRHETLIRNSGRNSNSRKTHCKHGHEFTPENTLRDVNGHRRCRTCRQIRDRKRWPGRSAAHKRGKTRR